MKLSASVVRRALIIGGVGLAALGLAALVVSGDGLSLPLLASLRNRFPSLARSGAFTGLGLEAIVIGTGLILIGWFAVPWRAQIRALADRPTFLPVVAMIVLVSLWLPIILLGRSAVIGGERRWWLDDDAMISMRYARNLAQDSGLVWNAGERVEGYTNFLWTAAMALVHLFPLDAAHTSLVILLTNLVLSVATIPYVARLVRLLGGTSLGVAAALTLLVFNKSLMAWNTTGVETALLAFLVTLTIARVIAEARADHPRLLTYVLIAVMSLVRADALVLAGLVYGLAGVLTPHRTRVIRYTAIALMLPLAHEIFRLAYYGDWLPNTAYLKVANWDDRVTAGARYVVDFIWQYVVLISVAVVGALRLPDRTLRWLVGLIAAVSVYVAFIGGDAFPYARFFVPILPLLMALAVVSTERLIARPALRAAVLLVCVVSTPLIVPGYFNNLVTGGYNADNVRIGLLLKLNAPATAKAADFSAGSVFYFSEGGAIDLLGKSDKHIARLAAVPANDRPGHNKYDLTYSLGELKPDFVIAPFHLPVDEDRVRALSSGDYSWMSDLYFNAIFQEHCLPYPIDVAALRSIFVCDWSDQFARRAQWQDLP
jgi:hypothetical protein